LTFYRIKIHKNFVLKKKDINQDDLDFIHNSGMKKWLENAKELERKKNRKSYPERHPFRFAIFAAIMGAVCATIAPEVWKLLIRLINQK
jgi:hypothetical protein